MCVTCSHHASDVRHLLLLRCILQLSILGYILVPIFTYNYWWLVLLYALFMIFIGALEAVGRPTTTYKVQNSVKHQSRRSSESLQMVPHAAICLFMVLDFELERSLGPHWWGTRPTRH